MKVLRLFFLITICWWSHDKLWAAGKGVVDVGPTATLDVPFSLERFQTLGFFELGADRVWLQFINYFGDKKQHAKSYPKLFSFLERAQAIDPYFLQVYQRVGLLSSLMLVDPGRMASLLQEGERHQPHDWLIPFLRASLLMQTSGNLGEAAEAMRVAAKRPEAPPYLGLLAVRLATVGGELDAALAVVSQLEVEASDESSRAVLAERRLQIQYEFDLRAYERAQADYFLKRGVHARRIEDLRALTETLALRDPWGEAYVLSDTQTITSPNDSKRLHVAGL